MRLHLVTLIAGFVVGGCGVDFATNQTEKFRKDDSKDYAWPVGWGDLSEGSGGSGGDLTQLEITSANPKANLSTTTTWPAQHKQGGSTPPTPPKSTNNSGSSSTGTSYAPPATVGMNSDYSPSGYPLGADIAPSGTLFYVGEVPSVGDFRTYTQGAWGTKASGNNPGSYRDQQFDAAFASGLKLGCSAGQHLVLTTSVAVAAFLPQGSQPSVLSSSWVDPTVTLAGELAGQVASLALNIGFDLADPAFCSSDVALQDLVLVGTPCAGMTVAQVLDLSNKVLGGCNATNAALINTCVTMINEAFDGGETTSAELRFPL